MKHAPCGPGVTRCKTLGRHRGGYRKRPVTRLAATGEAVEAAATTGGTERDG